MTQSINNFRNASIRSTSLNTSDIARRMNSSTQNTSTLSSSYRSSLRRMRTETPTSYPSTTTWKDFEKMVKSIEEFFSNLNGALKEGRYQDALKMVDQFERVWNETMLSSWVEYIEEEFPIQSSHLKPAIELLTNATLKEIKAYFLAMEKNPDALSVSEIGFEQLQKGFDEALALYKEMESSIDQQYIKDLELCLEAVHYFYRGMINTALNRREHAANDFKDLYRCYEKYVSSERFLEEGRHQDMKYIYGMKILEKKLGAQIITPPTEIDITDPESLFIAGRYEEALALLSEDTNEDFSSLTKPMCLAMLGRYTEALEQTYEPFDRAVIYYLQGELEMAKEEALKCPNQSLLLLLAIRGSEV